MADVFVGLGANLGDRAGQLREAVRRLAAELTIVTVSSLYETEPVGLREQPFFLNAVLRARTERSAREVLEVLEGIERAMGRRRDVPMGPRTIDLDLLLHDDAAVEEPGLVLPHPRMTERRFVLEPLTEIAPDVRLPDGRPAAELLEALAPGVSVERITLDGWPPALQG